MKKKDKKKVKVVYRTEDNGQTLYSMAALNGMTPEEQEELYEKRKNSTGATWRERWAMISAAITVYGPILLIVVLGFGAAALLSYFYLK